MTQDQCIHEGTIEVLESEASVKVYRYRNIVIVEYQDDSTHVFRIPVFGIQNNTSLEASIEQIEKELKMIEDGSIEFS